METMKSGFLIGHLNDNRNESALIRTAEAFGINQAFSIGKSRGEVANGVSRGSHKHVQFHYFNNIEEFISKAKEHNYSIVAVENTEGSKAIERDIDYPVNPIFIPGNEARGVPVEIIDNADKVVHIEQSKNSYMRCLNTQTATSIVMHDWWRGLFDRHKNKEQIY